MMTATPTLDHLDAQQLRELATRLMVEMRVKQVLIDNLTNEKYLQSVRYGQSNYGSPRNVTASVSWKF